MRRRYFEFLWLCSPALTCCSCDPPCLPDEVPVFADEAPLAEPDFEPPLECDVSVPLDAMIYSSLRDLDDPGGVNFDLKIKFPRKFDYTRWLHMQ